MKKALAVGLAVTIIIVGLVTIRSHQDVQKTIKIGVAVCLTGFGADWGEAERNAIQLAIAEANAKGGVVGKPIKLVLEDTACDSKTTVTVMTKLIHVDNVVAILGPTWGDAFIGAYPVLSSRKVVSISPSMAMESLQYNNIATDYVFSTWYPQHEEIEALQSYIEASGKNNVIILHDEDLFSSVMSEFFEQNAAAHNITIQKNETFPVGFNDFRATVLELKNIHADGIFAVFQNPAAKATFYKQAHELGLSVQFFSLTDIQNPNLVKDFQSALEGVIYTRPKVSARETQFDQAYREATNNAQVNLSTANAYDAANILIAALQKTSGSRDGLRDALLATEVPGVVTDTISFNEQHQIKGLEFNIKTIKNGQFVVVQ